MVGRALARSACDPVVLVGRCIRAAGDRLEILPAAVGPRAALGNLRFVFRRLSASLVDVLGSGVAGKGAAPRGSQFCRRHSPGSAETGVDYLFSRGGACLG